MSDVLELMGIPLWSLLVLVVGVMGLVLTNTNLLPWIKSKFNDAGTSLSSINYKGTNKEARLARLLADHNDFIWADNDIGAAKMIEAINTLKAEPPAPEAVNVKP